MSKSFYSLVVSMSTSRLSFAFFTMTFITILYTETESATLAATVTLTTTIAQITCGIFLPGITKFYSPKEILYVSQVSQLVIFMLLIVLFSFEMSALLVLGLFVLNFLLGLFYAATNPIKNAIVPSIINKNNLVKANTFLSTADQTLLLGGWAIGGILIAYIGNTALLFVSFLLLVLSLVCLGLIIFPSKQITPIRKTKKYKVFYETWTMLFKHPKVRTITMMDIIHGFGGTVWIGAVTLAFVTEVYSLDESWWGYINSAYFAGTILGGLIIWRISKKIQDHFIRSILISSLILGVLTFSYGLIIIPYVGLALVLIMGPFYQLMGIASRSFIQHVLKEDELAPVFASRATLNQIIFSLSIFLVGVIVDLFGPQFAYIFAGTLLLISTFVGFISFRRMNDNQYDGKKKELDIQ